MGEIVIRGNIVMKRFTRLHLILFGIVFLTAGLYFVQLQKQRRMDGDLAAIKAEQEAENMRFAREKMRIEQKEKKKTLAIRAVAVAGEYRIINIKRNMSVEGGTAILRQAKDNLTRENYDESWRLARLAIKEFKQAESLVVYYKVKYQDCLWKISLMPEHFGRGSGWVKIWRANEKQIPDFDIIRPGQNLLIPITKNNN